MSATEGGARFNLVDVTVLLFLFALIPVGYATYLLFKPAQPQIESVTPSVITREERRISAGSRLVAKFKIRGTGFTPLLRARIGDQDALGFVFENPSSADVLVGPLPPGAHDLVLVDGIQDVAVARGAISVQPENPAYVRAVGWLTSLDSALVETLKTGLQHPPSAPAFTIEALGPTQPARSTIRIGNLATEIVRPELVDREAVLLIRCEAAVDDNPCAIGGSSAGQPMPIDVGLPGPTRPFNLTVTELLPATAPAEAAITVRLDADSPIVIRSGDRDRLLDRRAALVTQVNRRGAATVINLSLGLDQSRTGWTYRGRAIHPGAPFTLRTAGYEVHGVVETVALPRND